MCDFVHFERANCDKRHQLGLEVAGNVIRGPSVGMIKLKSSAVQIKLRLYAAVLFIQLNMEALCAVSGTFRAGKLRKAPSSWACSMLGLSFVDLQ